MRNLLIDGRIRKNELDYLSNYFNIKKLPLSKNLYEEISGHSDIFYCKIKNKIICAPNAPIIEKGFIMGTDKVEKNYPKDVAYNACQIGNIIIGSKYTTSTINPDIIVKQGYVKCSICVTGKNSCITTDKNIHNKLSDYGINSLYVEENNIKLLDKNAQPTKMKGFIGGASLVFDNKFVLFGDIEKLNCKEKILEHLKKCNLQLVDFKGLDVNDYGGGIIY